MHYEFPKLKLIGVISFVLLFSCFERQMLTLRNTLATQNFLPLALWLLNSDSILLYLHVFGFVCFFATYHLKTKTPWQMNSSSAKCVYDTQWNIFKFKSLIQKWLNGPSVLDMQVKKATLLNSCDTVQSWLQLCGRQSYFAFCHSVVPHPLWRKARVGAKSAFKLDCLFHFYACWKLQMQAE